MAVYAPTMLALGADEAMHLGELAALRISDLVADLDMDTVQDNASAALELIERLVPLRETLTELRDARLPVSTDCRDFLSQMLTEEEECMAAATRSDFDEHDDDRNAARWRRDIVAGHLARVELALMHKRLDDERGR